MTEYFAMGGYGAFVWPAYGLSALVMVTLLVVSWRGLRQRERDLARLQAGRGNGQA